MKNILKKIGLVMLCVILSCGAFAQSADMDKLFSKYDSKRHFENSSTVHRSPCG